MYCINFLRIPFTSAINTFNISDNYTFAYLLSGNYAVIPSANDGFDIYSTGTGSQNGLLYFSGSGFWLGSGYTTKNLFYFYDSFDQYQTGQISGYGRIVGGTGIIAGSTGLTSGVNISGYSFFTGLYGHTIWSGYLN